MIWRGGKPVYRVKAISQRVPPLPATDKPAAPPVEMEAQAQPEHAPNQEDYVPLGRVSSSDEIHKPAARVGDDESCGLCPVSAPDGGEQGNGLPSAKGKAANCPSARRHTSNDALAHDTRTSRCEDGASPGPQDLPRETFECMARRPLGANDPQDCDFPDCACDDPRDEIAPTVSLGAVAEPSAAQRVAPNNPDDDPGPIPHFLRRGVG